MTDMSPTETRLRLLENGYTPLANVNKKCVLKAWNRLKVDKERVESWDGMRAYSATGVRLDNRLLVLDLDIDDADVLDDIWARLPQDLRDVLARAPLRYGGGVKEALFLRQKAGENLLDKLYSQSYVPPGGKATKAEAYGGGSTRYFGAFGPHSHDDETQEVLCWYKWADGISLVDVAYEDLPEIGVDDVLHVMDAASAAMLAAGWAYALESEKDSLGADSEHYDLTDDMLFDTLQYGVVDLAGLEEACQISDPEPVRLSVNWLFKGHHNKERCLARINPARGFVQIYEPATETLHFPASKKMDVAALGARLRTHLYSTQARLSKAADEGDSKAKKTLAVVTKAVESSSPLPDEEDDGGEVDGKEAIQVIEGLLHDTAEQTVAALRARHSRLFDMGGVPVVVDEDMKVRQARGDRLAHEMQRVLSFKTVKQLAKQVRIDTVEPPKALVGRVEALSYRLPSLRAVVDMPVMRRDGALRGEGYDEPSGLLVLGGEEVVETIPCAVDTTLAALALETLWKPFSEFPFAGPLDKGGALAAILTAVLRPVLPTAPMFVFDAPTQGSGKTLMSLAVGALAGGAQLMAPLPSKDEAEVRKILLSVLLEAPRAVVFDNQWGMLDSAVLAGMLTSDVFGGRLLGTNTTLKAPTSVLVMVTGNNVLLGGETPRRSVRIRIDAGMDTPFSRRFDFCPHAYARQNRAGLVTAALTLVRWALASAEGGRVGSFEVWDEMVGQTVAKIGREIDDSFGDPAEGIMAAHEDDPRRDELGEMLVALRDEFGNKWFSGTEVAARMSGGATNPLMEAFGLDKPPSSRTIGRLLTFRRDAVMYGMRIQVGRDLKTKVNRFRVWSDEDEDDVVVHGALEVKRSEQRAKLTAVTSIS